jgi:glutamyl-Q tRNA(Asp) synthetase
MTSPHPVDRPAYRGRFAPTPSGPLHLGSLLTALASWLQARAAGGRWLLRFDDLDGPRCPAGADEQILRQLDAHGLHWDEPPRWQSRHVEAYQAALDQLRAQGRLYVCDCTRAQLQQSALSGPDGPVYPGSCRDRGHPAPGALRVRMAAGTDTLDDPWQGPQLRALERDIGDFIVLRRDGRIAYQLASCVDEAAQGITEIVRGADLLGSSFRQAYLRRCLGLATIPSRHLPVLTGPDGQKLSKQNHASPLDIGQAPMQLWRCLEWLGQTPEPGLQQASISSLLAWAQAHWDPRRVPRLGNLPVVG